jgi:hypothetical protein
MGFQKQIQIPIYIKTRDDEEKCTPIYFVGFFDNHEWFFLG